MKGAEEAEPELPPAADPPPAPPGPGPGLGAEGRFSTREPPSWLSAGARAVIAIGAASTATKEAVHIEGAAKMSNQPPA